MDNMESHPSIELLDFIGTPITGKGEIEATIPGKCAAPPAPAIITNIPRPCALEAKSTIRFGVLCALTMVTSTGIPNSFRISTASCIICRSESLPIITLTNGCFFNTGTADFDFFII